MRAHAMENLGALVKHDELEGPIVYIVLQHSILEELRSIQNIEMEDWRVPVVHYLLFDALPEDRHEARKLRVQATHFCLIDGKLFKRSIEGPYLKCLGPTESREILEELHERSAGNHSGGRSLAFRCHRTGYYWPSMKADAARLVQKCDKSQRFAKTSHMPATTLNSVSAPWPFDKWEMDIIGPLPTSTHGRKRFILMITDYFTKWVEAEAFEKVREQEVQKFLWKHVICKFRVPREVHTDNDPQFASQVVKDFCSSYGIKLTFFLPRYPQANGQAEASNKAILDSLKKRLESAKGWWLEVFPEILWAFRTTMRTSTQQSPFSMVYGAGSVLPVESLEGTA